VFGEGRFIGLVFASIAAPMALASWLNSRFITRFGLRRVGHSASLALAILMVTHAAIGLSGHESLPLFVVMQGLSMAGFAFASSNLGTLAMERMAPIAGTASSVQGVVGTLGAAIIAYPIGQAFDGSVRPYVLGCAICAVLGFTIIVLTEPRRLFARIASTPEAVPVAPEDLC
jgi:DHA1 family bicyclomycin/chloramphenicol resistance-like MFS transporter